MISIYLKEFTETEFSLFLADKGNLLSQAELDEFSMFKVLKRQREWLCSRVLLKNLVLMQPQLVGTLNKNQLTVKKEPTGVPFIEIETFERMDGFFAISHSGYWAACGFTPDRILHFGLDIEVIADHSDIFVVDYFTESEIELVNGSSKEHKALISTLIWSAKEAVLKALTEGLRMDTRNIEIAIPKRLFLADWQPLEILSEQNKNWRLFARQSGDLLLTLCIPNTTQLDQINLVIVP
jgi:phosphopantetheinyl transferase